MTGDEGFFALKQIEKLHQSGVRTVIADPQAGRRRQDLPAEDRRTLHPVARATASASGKALLRKRGEHLEREFSHVLDHGGLRRTTLRGCDNLTKRHLVAALSFNISLLLRTIFGVGTAKQWLAGAAAALLVALWALWRLFDAFFTSRHRRMNRPPSDPTPSFHLYRNAPPSRSEGVNQQAAKRLGSQSVGSWRRDAGHRQQANRWIRLRHWHTAALRPNWPRGSARNGSP